MTRNQLESLQTLSHSPYLNPPDHPAECSVVEINPFKPWCPKCKKEVKTTDGQCNSCFHMIGDD